MGGLISLVLGVGFFVLCAPFFRGRSAALAYYTVVSGFIFWYWLPAANLLTVGYVGVAFFQITPSVNDACWLVLAAEVATVILLLMSRPLFGERIPDGAQLDRPVLSIVALASAVLFLLARFATEGTGVLVDLALGLSSARESIDYSNLSSGASASLFGLWESCTLWLGLFVLGRHIYSRSLASGFGASALAALTFLFVASGTRAVLMQAIVVAGISVLARPNVQRRIRGGLTRALFWSVPFFLFLALISAAFTSRFALDAGYSRAGPLATLMDTLVVNNDMMRELAFVLDTMNPMMASPKDFILTPFSYMMPSFLGFDKEVPAHLLMYNQLRIGVDVTTNQGNAFPGLVADFWLNFGVWGSIICGAFITASALVIARIRFSALRSIDQFSYFATGLSYVFFNFRNITGAFALTMIFGAGLLILMSTFGGKTSRHPLAPVSGADPAW